MKFENGKLIKITNKDVEEMIEGIQKNYILREGLCGADLTECDMSDLDFEHFKLLCFDENTKFSEEQQKRFKIDEFIKAARAPMVELQELHSKGIDGKGVKVAIIDTNIDIEAFKEKYGGNIQYVDSKLSGEIEQHGKTVLSSFLQTAPNAEVIYFPLDKTQEKEKKLEFFEQYIEQIKKEGIKIISFSSTLENITEDKEKRQKIKENLEEEGIALIDSQKFGEEFIYCFRDISEDGSYSYKKCCMEAEDSYYEGVVKEKIHLIKKCPDGFISLYHIAKAGCRNEEKRNPKNYIRIPCGGRILADKYWGASSNSYTIPVVSGLFAMCKQIDSQMKYEDFVNICNETSKQVDECNLIQPQYIIEKVKEIQQNKKTRNEFVKELKVEKELVEPKEKVKQEEIKINSIKDEPSIDDDL